MKYKHIQFNNMLQKIDWVLEQVTDEWKLVSIVPVDMYESIAIFVTHTPKPTNKTKEQE